MEHAIQKAKVLVEALNWIHQFRDRYVVVKLGGSALEEPDAVRSCLRDVIFMEAVGMRYVRTFFPAWDDPLPGSDEGEVEYEMTRAMWEERGPVA